MKGCPRSLLSSIILQEEEGKYSYEISSNKAKYYSLYSKDSMSMVPEGTV